MQKAVMACGMVLLVALVAEAQEAARQMNVTQGPEAVFAQPPAEIMPLLADARPTRENGRVGPELVFWGYERPSGQRLFFFACAPLEGVDCPQRVQQICPVATTVIETREAVGNMVHRSCRAVANAAPGDRRPGCNDREADVGLEIGVVSCG